MAELSPTRRGVREGIGFGLIAGLVFAIAEVVASVAMGNSVLSPFRLIASVLLGRAALDVTPPVTAFIVGTLVHLVLSAGFGLIYGVVNARFSKETQTAWSRQAGIGLLFGVAVWLVNFQVIARFIYPWFLETPQFLQMMLHALFFGLPLALLYAAVERRVQHVRRAPAPV